eukprot:4882547-Amphidinium_carterae.1
MQLTSTQLATCSFWVVRALSYLRFSGACIWACSEQLQCRLKGQSTIGMILSHPRKHWKGTSNETVNRQPTDSNDAKN